MLAGIYLLLLAITSTVTNLFGIDARAIVVEHHEDSDSEYGTTYQLSFAVRVNGNDFSKSASVSRREFHLIRDGQEIGIRYMPPFPQATAAIYDARISNRLLLIWAITVFWNFSLILMLSCILLEPLKEQKALKYGLVAVGHVLGKDCGDSGESSFCAVSYQFQDRFGSSVNSTCTVSKRISASVSAGQELTVFYLKDNPKCSVAYELCNYVLISCDREIPPLPAKQGGSI